MDHWRHAIENLPFIGLMVGDQRTRPYITRLLEQATPGIMVGLMVAGLGVWKSDSVQDERIRHNSERITKQDLMITDMRTEFGHRFDKLEQKIDKIDYALKPVPLNAWRGKSD